MEHKALGKGLAALIPEKQESTKSDLVAYVRTEKVRFNQSQPRSGYDQEKLNELIASIKEKGLLQPILVREKEDGYEVIAGERRLRAAMALGLEEVPVAIKNVTDKDSFVLALIENIQREDLNPIEQAKAYKKLIEDFHLTQENIAQSVGKDRSTVTNFLRLLKLSDEIQESLYRGELSFGHARALLSIEDLQQQKEIFNYIRLHGASVRELEKLIRKKIDKRSINGRRGLLQKQYEIIILEEDLQKALGTKVQIRAKKRKGKIIIEYYSLGDLERIIKVIKNV